MPYPVHSPLRGSRLRLSALVLLGLAAACGGSDQLSPSTDLPLATGDSLALVDSTPVPLDSTLLTPTDSLAGVSPLTALTAPGIGFGAFNMPGSALNSIHNSTMQGLEPAWLMAELSIARSKGARLILKMVGGSDDRYKNADGTFSLTKWKALVYRFKALPLASYINDGTLMGSFLIDEPHNPNKWGGKPIPQATVEAMAKYSKQLWPSMTTFARVMPTWLAQSTTTYIYLDAAWVQYETYQGNVTTKITNEVAAAKKKAVGLIVGLNVLDGGNGSSGIRGTRTGKYAMSATELRNYGTVLLNQTYACGFFNWTYILGGSTYFARSDIKSAMTDLSKKAKAHVKTSCRQ
jgi:hypothetical protein